MKFKQLKINSSRKLVVYPAQRKSAQRKTMIAKEKPSRVLNIFDAPQKTMSSSASTADNSELKGAKNRFNKCLQHKKLRTAWTFLQLRWHQI